MTDPDAITAELDRLGYPKPAGEAVYVRVLRALLISHDRGYAAGVADTEADEDEPLREEPRPSNPSGVMHGACHACRCEKAEMTRGGGVDDPGVCSCGHYMYLHLEDPDAYRNAL